MATLDVLDYVVELDDALAPTMGPGERKLAKKDVRRLVEDLAFRFAFMEGRVMPEDIDYARALEAIKPPARAASVLQRRAPVYRQRRVRKLVTTFAVLGVLALFTAGFTNFVSSESADVLVDSWLVGSGAPMSGSESTTFVVDAATSRIQFTASVVVLDDKSGLRENSVTLIFLDPSGTPRFEKVFTSDNAVYAKAALEAPTPGEWTIYADFRDAAASVEVTVLGVSPG